MQTCPTQENLHPSSKYNDLLIYTLPKNPNEVKSRRMQGKKSNPILFKGVPPDPVAKEGIANFKIPAEYVNHAYDNYLMNQQSTMVPLNFQAVMYTNQQLPGKAITNTRRYNLVDNLGVEAYKQENRKVVR